MAKAKIKLSANELEKLPVAAELSNVECGQVQKIGPVLQVQVSYRDAANLFELGKLISQVSADEAKAFKDQRDKEAKAKAEKEAGKGKK